jgi:hypothetical protein
MSIQEAAGAIVTLINSKSTTPTQEEIEAIIERFIEAPVRSKPVARQDWLTMLRDAGPNGAAPDLHHAAIWGAILDLRWCRDTIENTVAQMTEKLDWLANETALTHAIAAGWEPEEDPGS